MQETPQKPTPSPETQKGQTKKRAVLNQDKTAAPGGKSINDTTNDTTTDNTSPGLREPTVKPATVIQDTYKQLQTKRTTDNRQRTDNRQWYKLEF
jgi:hypothetical protein